MMQLFFSYVGGINESERLLNNHFYYEIGLGRSGNSEPSDITG